MTPSERLTPERVAAWLDRVEDDAIVGERDSHRRCPLARYLGRDWVVTADAAYQLVPPGREVSLPVWAQRFVGYVDTLGDGPVSAREARKHLDLAVFIATLEEQKAP
jgi:hypothetical protein